MKPCALNTDLGHFSAEHRFEAYNGLGNVEISETTTHKAYLMSESELWDGLLNVFAFKIHAITNLNQLKYFAHLLKVD